MKATVVIEKVTCPTCKKRLFDKEEGAIGFTREKCRVCKTVWRIDLKNSRFTKIS